MLPSVFAAGEPGRRHRTRPPQADRRCVVVLTSRLGVRLSPSVPAPPTLPVLGDAEDLASGRRGPVLLRRAQSEVVEDSVDGVLIAHEGEDAHALAATETDERIHLVDLRDQPGPAWGAAPPGLRLGRDAGGVGLGAVGSASDAVRVLAVESVRCCPGSGMWSLRRASHSSGSRASKLRPSDGFMRER